MNTFQERLKQYKEEIASWDWDKIQEEASENPYMHDDSILGSSYLGTVTSLCCSGQTEDDESCDDAFREALEAVAEEYGMFIENGEGNPCDVYAVMNLGSHEDIFTEDDGFWYLGRKIADTEEELREWMERQQVWPEIWSISDHGNISWYEMEPPMETIR